MRLARFAVAGLALGLAAGFVSALLRPRPRSEPVPEPSRSIADGGGPISWGSRPPVIGAAAPAGGAVARLATPFAPNGTGPGPVAR